MLVVADANRNRYKIDKALIKRGIRPEDHLSFGFDMAWDMETMRPVVYDLVDGVYAK